MRIYETDTLDGLVLHFEGISKRAPGELRGVVREGIRAGNSIAKDFARRSSGRHGRHYPNAFSTEMHANYGGFGSRIYSGEYGPDISKPQGGMSFERGSRNQKPHLDLARSADIIGGSFAQETRHAVERLFDE